MREINNNMVTSDQRMEAPVYDPSVRLSAFEAKIEQTLLLIDIPLLILNLKERNPNYIMYTTIEDHASPAALIINPDGGTSLIVNNMELDLVRHYSQNCTIRLYGGMAEFYKRLHEALPAGEKIYGEISENLSDLDLLPRHIYSKLTDNYVIESARDILVELRSVKTEQELRFINVAVQETLDIFEQIRPLLVAGTPEAVIAHEIMTTIIRQYANISFKPIVSSGPRVINPHPVRHTGRELKNGDWLIIDFGLSINGYTSDLTRTYLIGGDFREHPFYQTYEEMYQLLITEDLTQLTPRTLALKLREIVNGKNLAGFEKHGYGHGLGVEIHDISPSISTCKSLLSEKPLRDNMVFTFEPGFYDDETLTGFRIENDFLIEKGKAVRLGK